LLPARNTSHWQRYLKTENEKMKNDIPRKVNLKQAGVDVCIYNKADFKLNLEKMKRATTYR
jgi:hypothetical protein